MLRDLFVIFLLGRLAAEILTRLKQPTVIGELLVGIAIGPHALGWVQEGEVLHAIAEIGVVFLLFEVGLENRLSDLRRVGRTASAVAVSGVVVPFVFGFGLLFLLDHDTSESLFTGAALVATSVGVTARVIADLGLSRERESHTILGAAVIDDVLGLMVLAVVVGTTRGELITRDLVILLVEVVVFLDLAATVGTRAARWLGPELARLRLADGPFVVGILVCLGMAALAARIGLAAIVGAFLAGMIFAETSDHYDMAQKIAPVTNFLTPFFVFTGMAVDPSIFTRPATLALIAAVFVVAVISKLVPCSLAARSFGRRGALIVGVGMVPRAEVGIIVASLGLASGTIGTDIYGVVVAMSILTSLAPPPVLRYLFRERIGPDWR